MKDKKQWDNNPIGIYDSGVGGLTVWREIRRQLPGESLVYLGDGKNCPYGSLPMPKIKRLADKAVATLIEKGCKMIVVACNTASAVAIDSLREKYKSHIIVGMEPAVKPACKNTETDVIGVLATARSLKGNLYHHTTKVHCVGVNVISVVGEGLVELVEQNKENTPEALEKVRKVLYPILDRGADQIVLGCTHYPFLLHAFKQAIAEHSATVDEKRSITLIDPSVAVADYVSLLFNRHTLWAATDHEPIYEFITFANEGYRQFLEIKSNMK